MIQSSDIKKMVRSVLRREKGLQDPRIMHPTREWFTGLAVVCLIVIVGGGYSAVSYITFESSEYSDTEASQGLTTYRAAQVGEAIVKYTNKKNEHQRLVGTIPEVIFEPVATSTASSTPETSQPAVADEDTVPAATTSPEVAIPAL